MEPQEIYCCDDRKGCKKVRCLWIITVILLTLFVGVVGVIIGALIAGLILIALPAVIVLAIVLGILLALAIILLICNRKREKHC